MRAADGKDIFDSIESILGGVESIYKNTTEKPKPTNTDKADMDLEIGFGQQEERLIWGMSPVVFAGIAVLAGVLLIGVVYFATQNKK
jgi:hypothetical protein